MAVALADLAVHANGDAARRQKKYSASLCTIARYGIRSGQHYQTERSNGAGVLHYTSIDAAINHIYLFTTYPHRTLGVYVKNGRR